MATCGPRASGASTGDADQRNAQASLLLLIPSEAREGAVVAAQTDDRPVFVCLAQGTTAQELAVHLREHGLRARSFDNPDAMAQACNDEPPAALVVGLEQACATAAVGSCKAEHAAELVIAAPDNRLATYLAAIRADASAVVTAPINRAALRHRLRRVIASPGRHDRVALVSTARAPRFDGYALEVLAPDDDVLTRLEAWQPDLIVLDTGLVAPTADELAAVIRQRPALRLPPLLGLARDGAAPSVQLDGIIALEADADPGEQLRAHLSRRRELLEGWRLLSRRDADTGLYRREELLQALTGLLEAPEAGTACLLHLSVTSRGSAAAAHERAMVAAAQDLLDRVPPLAVPARLDRERFAVLLVGMSPAAAEELARELSDRLHAADGSRVSVAFEVRTIEPGRDTLESLTQPARDDAGDTAPVLRGHWRETVEAALAQNRFRLLYQPISGIHGRPCGFYEVFVRLIGSDGEEIPPSEFLPALTGSPLAAQLDRWVFGRALHILAQRRAESADQPTLFVKLSAEGLADPAFADWLAAALAREDVPASQLVVEITAATLAEADTRERLADMAVSGVAVALEHVTDARTLERLTGLGLPLHYVKPTPALTASDADTAARRELAALAKAARGTGLRLVATQVQDALSLTYLWQVGIDYVQGHFMQRPTNLFGTGGSTSNRAS